MEPTEICGHLSVQAGALGERILTMYPPLQITTGETPTELLTLQRTPLPPRRSAVKVPDGCGPSTITKLTV